MKKQKNDIIILLKGHSLDTPLYRQEVARIYSLVKTLNTAQALCKVHELVNRNYITSRKSHLLRFFQEKTHPPFRFLINKN